jgi:hypothetical protein
MEIIKYVQKYDPETGEPTLERDGLQSRCDWSGEPWNSGSLAEQPYARYILDYGNKDPCFGSSGEVEREFARDFGVRMNVFLGKGPYAIKQPYENTAMEAFTSSDDWSFHWFLRRIRVSAARELIESGDIDPHQIPGFELPTPDMYDSVDEWKEALEASLD